MREVPLAFPLAAADSSCSSTSDAAADGGCRCYTVADDASTLEMRTGWTNAATVPHYRDQNTHVSSVSKIGNGAMITVAPAAGESCLSVTLLVCGDAEPVVTQLDFHSVAPMIPLYKTKAYRVSDTLLQLMVVTASPTVFTIWFDLPTLTPQIVPGTRSQQRVRTTHIRREVHAAITATTTTSSFYHNMVGFLGSDRILVEI